MGKAKASEIERVAVVGGGIGGLSAAYHIAKYGGNNVEVTLFEQNNVLGGHEMTHDTAHGKVDLGYMVCNYECYPNLMRFYQEHLIPLEKTAMGFSIQNSKFQWAFGDDLGNAMRMLIKPKFWKFVRSKSKFHADGLAFIEQRSPPKITLRQFCNDNGYDTAFVEGWLQPFCEAVWSAPTSTALDMEAYTILCFLRNHGFLRWAVLQWYTPKGRTSVTIERFTALFAELGVTVRTSSTVKFVTRPAADGAEVNLTLADESVHTFDKVVLATPSGTALKLMSDVDAADTAALGGFTSTANRVVLHTDAALMPTNRQHWVSWNVIQFAELEDLSALTYWVRPLQHVPVDNLFISLNPPPKLPAKGTVLHELWTAHPVLNVAAARCQHVVQTRYNGHRSVWHAGAWLHYGFHEDGFRSGIEAARSLLGDMSIPLMPVEATPVHLEFSGWTTHTRYDESGKVVHGFRYPISYDYVDVDVGVKRWWGGLYRADHLGDPADTLSVAVRKEVAAQTGHWPVGAIDVVTMLREYGAVFNPITLYFCWDSTERNKVDFVVSEVTNTPWGQRAVQVLPMADAVRTKTGTMVIERVKNLHVSPFQPVPDGRAIWRYTFTLPTRELKELKARIELLPEPGSTQPKVVATMDLTNTGSPWLRCRGIVPCSWKALFRIHYQAVVLMVSKGQKYHGNTTQAQPFMTGDNPPFVPNTADIFNGEVWIRAVLAVLIAVVVYFASALLY